MFCGHCGEELGQTWEFCPNCGERAIPRKQIKKNQGFLIFGFEGKMILKLLVAIIIISFFCPMFLISDYETEDIKMSGTDIAFGIEYMGKRKEMAKGFALFLILPCIALAYMILISKKKKYGIICSSLCGTCAIWLLYLYFNLKEGMKDPYFVKPLAAYYLYIIASLAVVALGIYSDYLERKKHLPFVNSTFLSQSSKEKSIRECVLLIIAGVFLFNIVYSFLCT